MVQKTIKINALTPNCNPSALRCSGQGASTASPACAIEEIFKLPASRTTIAFFITAGTYFLSENNMLREGQDCPSELVRQSDIAEKNNQNQQNDSNASRLTEKMPHAVIQTAKHSSGRNDIVPSSADRSLK